MSLTQLNPPLPLETPKGRGWAHFVLDYSQEHDLIWTVFLNETGECWSFPNSEVRMVNNFSLGRPGYVNHSSDYARFGPGDIPGQPDPVLGHRVDGQTPGEGKPRETPRVAAWVFGDGPA